MQPSDFDSIARMAGSGIQRMGRVLPSPISNLTGQSRVRVPVAFAGSSRQPGC
jgi:hypothetical protein